MIGLYSAAETQTGTSWLRQHHPGYLSFCKVRGIELPLVPRARVAQYYIPETRLLEVLDTPKDALEGKTARLIDHLSESTGVPTRKFGVTGSILLGTHHPKLSDINLTILGNANSWKARESTDSMYEKEIKPHSPTEIRIWQRERAQLLGIPDKYKNRLIWPHWLRGRIDGTPFHLHPTREDEEITTRYGDEFYTALEPVELTATITDDSESLFAPVNFSVDDVEIIKGSHKSPLIDRIVSFEGIFVGCANTGDKVRVLGILEEVKDKEGHLLRHQVVIGTFSTQGWIIPL
jgi:predicted nucleotidyltransferase